MEGKQIYTIYFDKEERENLEKVRAKIGTRSASDTIRILLRKEASA